MNNHSNSLSAGLDRLSKARVLVVGDIMHDIFIWGQVKRISPEAPVPVVEVSRETSLLGGAANVVNNVLALGARCTLAGVIGTDAAGEAVLADLDRAKAGRSAVVRSMTRPTAVKTRVIAHHQQVVRFDREENRPLKPSTFKKLWKAISDVLPRVDAVIVSDYNKGLVDARLMKRLGPACRERGIIMAVDPKPENIHLYRGATVITPNHREAALAAGLLPDTEEDQERAGQILLEKLECLSVLVTRGEKGMSLHRPGKPTAHVPARAQEVYDVTGAGDTVIAVFTTALVAGMDMVAAMRTANLAGAVVVGKLGTSTASVGEIRALIGSRGHK